MSLPSHPDLLAEKLQTRSILNIAPGLVSGGQVRRKRRRTSSIADNIWDATDHDGGFALLEESVDVLNIGEDLPSDVEKNDGEHYDELPAWGLESDLQIQMAWDWGLPFSHRSDLTAVVVPSGKRLYVLDIKEGREQGCTPAERGQSLHRMVSRARSARSSGVVRTQFGFPVEDHQLLETLQTRGLRQGLRLTKIQIVRAGLRGLDAMTPEEFGEAVEQSEPLKPGRKPIS